MGQLEIRETREEGVGSIERGTGESEEEAGACRQPVQEPAAGVGRCPGVEVEVDPETGQALTASFMDYYMPRAGLIPDAVCAECADIRLARGRRVPAGHRPSRLGR